VAKQNRMEFNVYVLAWARCSADYGFVFPSSCSPPFIRPQFPENFAIPTQETPPQCTSSPLQGSHRTPSVLLIRPPAALSALLLLSCLSSPRAPSNCNCCNFAGPAEVRRKCSGLVAATLTCIPLVYYSRSSSVLAVLHGCADQQRELS
jgi:hypothetical protein